MPAAAAIATVGAAAIGASAQSKAAKKAANAQVAAADRATQLERDAANYSINAGRPQTQAQGYLNALRLAGLGVPISQVNQYMGDAYAASLQNLPDGSSSGGGGGARLGGSGFFDSEGQPWNWDQTETVGASPSGAPTPLADDFQFSDFYRNTPGYQSGLDAQQSALERRAAAGGDYFSGDLVTQAMRNASDYEDRNYWNYWDNLGNAFTPGSTSGQNNASNVAINFGDAAAGNAIRAGDARATGYNAQGNIWGNFWQGAAGIPMYGQGQGWWGKG